MAKCHTVELYNIKPLSSTIDQISPQQQPRRPTARSPADSSPRPTVSSQCFSPLTAPNKTSPAAVATPQPKARCSLRHRRPATRTRAKTSCRAAPFARNSHPHFRWRGATGHTSPVFSVTTQAGSESVGASVARERVRFASKSARCLSATRAFLFGKATFICCIEISIVSPVFRTHNFIFPDRKT